MTDSEHRGSRDGRTGAGSDIDAALARLERAIGELAGSARDQLTERASSLINDTSRRIERELSRRRSGEAPGGFGSARGSTGGGERWRSAFGGAAGAGRRAQPEDELAWAPRRMCRDPERQKIGGVCAGLARYYGIEPWVARCIAVTGLLFFPSIVFPAYWVLFFVMDKPPAATRGSGPHGTAANGAGGGGAATYRGAAAGSASAPGPSLPPRYSLRNVQAALSSAELRLRRMEGHVTSDGYELQRQIAQMEEDHRGRTA